MPKVKTITLGGEETAVKFSDGYPYYIITNLGDDEIYASGNPDITAYADGVYTILPGMETRISPEKSADTVYLLGEGKVQIRAEEIAVPTSFRAVSKGGDSGGGESGVTDYSLLTNKPIDNNVGIDNLSGKNTNSWYDLLCLQNIREIFHCLLLITVYADANNNETMLASIELSSPKNTAKFQLLSGMGNNIFDQVKITSDNSYLSSLYYWNIQFHLASTFTNTRSNIKVRVELIFDPKQAQDPNFAYWIFPNNNVKSSQTTRFSMNLDLAKPFSYNNLRDTPNIPIVDSALSVTSTNPVQNMVITAAINALSDRIS